ncbi:unnamed protein product, partial [Closterium sp. NIES-54]
TVMWTGNPAVPWCGVMTAQQGRGEPTASWRQQGYMGYMGCRQQRYMSFRRWQAERHGARDQAAVIEASQQHEVWRRAVSAPAAQAEVARLIGARAAPAAKVAAPRLVELPTPAVLVRRWHARNVRRAHGRPSPCGAAEWPPPPAAPPRTASPLAPAAAAPPVPPAAPPPPPRPPAPRADTPPPPLVAGARLPRSPARAAVAPPAAHAPRTRAASAPFLVAPSPPPAALQP